jgi:GNAT superfamily N-acetyltransferase
MRSWQVAYRGHIPDPVLDALPESRERRLAQHLARRDTVWVAEEEGAIVGHAAIGPCRDDDQPSGTGEVYAIYLAPEAWGRGIGRELFTKAVDELRAAGFTRATLWVLETNARARHFYEAAGWRADGARKADEVGGAALIEVRYAVDLRTAGTPPD